MAFSAEWVTQSWRMTDAVKKGEFVTRDRHNEGRLRKQTSVPGLVYGVAVRDLEAGDLFDGHHTGEQSAVIEVLAGANIPAGAEVVCSNQGRGIPFNDATHGEGYIVGITFRGAVEGEIFECTVHPRFEYD